MTQTGVVAEGMERRVHPVAAGLVPFQGASDDSDTR